MLNLDDSFDLTDYLYTLAKDKKAEVVAVYFTDGDKHIWKLDRKDLDTIDDGVVVIYDSDYNSLVKPKFFYWNDFEDDFVQDITHIVKIF